MIYVGINIGVLENSFLRMHLAMGVWVNYYRVTVWVGYYQVLPDIIGYFQYSFKVHELPGDKNVWK